MNETNEIETNEVEFIEPVGRAPQGDGLSGDRSVPVRIGIVAGSALLVAVGAVSAMGASPSPSTPTTDPAPGASAAPGTTTTDPDHDSDGPGFGMRGDFGPGGFREINIASISGSNLSLATDDGWSRTIAVASTTTITKRGATITLGDLAVGDQIRFGQTKNADGTYTITAIRVILPSVAGQVTAINGDALTITQPDGTTATIHVSAATTYQVRGVTAPTLADIKVGAFVVGVGTLRTDGSLDAAMVDSGFRGGPGHDGRGSKGHGPGFGPGFNDGDADDVAPNAPPALSTTPG